MKVHLFCSLFLLLFSLNLFADVEVLPEEDIIGGNQLHSKLLPQVQLLPELRLPDVTDSLFPVLPVLPPVPLPVPHYVIRHYALLGSLGNGWNSHLRLLANIAPNHTLSFSASSQTPSSHWSNYPFDLRYLYENPAFSLQSAVSCLSVTSPLTIAGFNSQSIGVQLNIPETGSLPLPFSVNLASDLTACQTGLQWKSTTGHQLIWKPALQISYPAVSAWTPSLSLAGGGKALFLDAAFRRKTAPGQSPFPWLKGISLLASYRRIVPGLEFAGRTSPFPSFDLLIAQSSTGRFYSSPALFALLPWQIPSAKSLVTLTPLDCLASLGYTHMQFSGHPVLLTLADRLQYSLDAPLFFPANKLGNSGLPLAKPTDVLRETGTLAATCRLPGITLSQNISLARGWLPARSFGSQPYLPLLAEETSVQFSQPDYSLQVSFKQAFRTFSDQHRLLRDMLSPGFDFAYHLDSEWSLVVEGENLCHRGVISYRTLPAQPVTVNIGIRGIF